MRKRDSHPMDDAMEAFLQGLAARKAPNHIRGTRRLVWSAADWVARNCYLVTAIIVGAPFAILTIIAYDNGYSGWIEMIRDWLSSAG